VISSFDSPLSQRLLQILLIIPLIVLFNCQDDASEKQGSPPKYLRIVPYQSWIEAGKTKMQSISVRILDADSLPKSNVNVLFKVNGDDVSISAPLATTNNEGYATIDVTFGTKIGYSTIVVDAFGLQGSPAEFSFFIRATSPKTMVIVSGNEQEDKPNTALRDQLVVNLRDEFDNPVEGATVFFKVIEPDGQVSSTSMLTQSDGNAHTAFRLGVKPVSKVEASFNDQLKVIFNEYALAPVYIKTILPGKGNIDLSWTSNTNPTFERYIIYRAIEGIYNYQPITEITNVEQLIFTDKTVVSGYNYIYYVRTLTKKQNYADSEHSTGVAGHYISFKEAYQLYDIAIDEDSETIFISNNRDSRIIMLSLETFAKIDSVQLNDRPGAIALSQDHKRLYISLQGKGAYCVLELATKKITQKLDISGALGTNNIQDIYPAPRGQVFATSSGKYIAKIDESDNSVWRVASSHIFSDAPGTIIGDNGKSLYIVGGTGSLTTIKLDITKDNAPKVLSIDEGDHSASLSSDGKWMYLPAGKLLDTEDFKSLGHLGKGSRVAFSKDCKHSYSASQGWIQVYNTSTQLLERKIPFGLEASRLFINAVETEAIIQVNSEYPSRYFTRLYKLPLVK
jgi:hypothetical protein